jgi:predicted ribosome-associated RNA-binding protein Tma20
MTELFLDEHINKVEVFPGIYVGDVVVSLEENTSGRKIGDIFKVLVESRKGWLDYKDGYSNSNSYEWRLATHEEKEAFEKGVTNINAIKKEPEEDFSKFIGQWVTYHKWSKKSVCKIRYIKKRKEDSYHVFFNKGYVDFEASLHVYWGIDSKDLKILSKEELKDYLPKDVYMKEFPETVKSTSLQDYLNSIPDTFTGELEGFPKEIVQKMVERQVEQGNEPDYKVFEEEISAFKKIKGFDWMESKEDYGFWEEVISKKHFNTFYEKYPKTETKVTTTNIYNVEGDIYGILTSDGNITTIDTKDYIIPIVKHSHISTNSRYVIDDGRYVKEHFIKDHELNESYQKNSLENKTTTFEHLPFIQVKPLELF